MNSPMTEWEFTADAASWINEHLARNPRLPFSRAKCEQRGSGSTKRRDLTLLDKNQVIVLTGEVKLPFQKDGGSPYIESVVQDARQKAPRQPHHQNPGAGPPHYPAGPLRHPRSGAPPPRTGGMPAPPPRIRRFPPPPGGDHPGPHHQPHPGRRNAGENLRRPHAPTPLGSVGEPTLTAARNR
jgi:hypothetical protein